MIRKERRRERLPASAGEGLVRQDARWRWACGSWPAVRVGRPLPGASRLRQPSEVGRRRLRVRRARKREVWNRAPGPASAESRPAMGAARAACAPLLAIETRSACLAACAVSTRAGHRRRLGSPRPCGRPPGDVLREEGGEEQERGTHPPRHGPCLLRAGRCAGAGGRSWVWGEADQMRPAAGRNAPVEPSGSTPACHGVWMIVTTKLGLARELILD